MTTLYPTHACFDDALDFLSLQVKRGVSRSALLTRYTLVHGICLSDAGEPYAHGWVEETDSRSADGVWQGAMADVEGKRERVFYLTYKHEFYVAYRVQKTTSYTVLEALAENERSGHYGPWVQEYRELLADGDHSIMGSIELEQDR